VAALKFAQDKPIVPSFDGYGAQYNQNLFAARSKAAGVTHIPALEERLRLFEPHLVRIFFNADAWDDKDLMDSYVDTLELAQRTAGAINITFQGLGPKVLKTHPDAIERFAGDLVRHVKQDKISKLRWVTLRNEPNTPPPKPKPGKPRQKPLDKRLYKSWYVELDRRLKRAELRSQIHLMGGDLIKPGQRPWLNFMAKNMHDLLDAYSVHIYWDYRKPQKLLERLTEVHHIVHVELPAKGLKPKPLYVMEYGVRGISAKTEPEPGHHASGRPIADTLVNAFQRAWFALEAAKRGYRGAVTWDAYYARYDKKRMMFYSLLDKPEAEDWPLRPAFRVMRLLMRAARPGWKVVPIEGCPPSQCLVGFHGGSGKLAVAGLDTEGAHFDGGAGSRTYTIAGLPAKTQFQLCLWNGAGDGRNSFDGKALSDENGVVRLTAPLHSIFVLTKPRIS
jgi:hypothetical protein